MRRRSWLSVAAVFVGIVALLWWNRLGRSDGPEDVWRRAYKAMLVVDYGTVYDCLSIEAQREADELFVSELVKETDRCADPAEADWLRSIRSREAYIEVCSRTDRSVPQIQWTDIDRTEVYGNRAQLTVSRPATIAVPTMGTVDMVRESGTWKIRPMWTVTR